MTEALQLNYLADILQMKAGTSARGGHLVIGASPRTPPRIQIWCAWLNNRKEEMKNLLLPSNMLQIWKQKLLTWHERLNCVKIKSWP